MPDSYKILGMHIFLIRRQARCEARQYRISMQIPLHAKLKTAQFQRVIPLEYG